MEFIPRHVAFEEVIETIGGKNSARIIESKGNWEFWRVEYPTPAGIIFGYYLYLHYKCPLNEASTTNLAAWREAATNSEYTIVMPPRSELAKEPGRTMDKFGGKRAINTRKLLLENVLSQVQPTDMDGLVSSYFISSDIETSDGDYKRALGHISEWLQAWPKSSGAPKIAVLSADAGLGKTTVARAIAQKIISDKDFGAIPILVESSQWKSMLQGELDLKSVWNIAISNTFSNPSVISNEKVFNVLVKERLLIPIFDGFDELCLHLQNTSAPADIIKNFIELLGDNGAHILITTRDTFWETIQTHINPDDIERFHLRGFSAAQRKEFFQKRLKPEEKDLALRIAKEIGGGIYEGLAKESHQADRACGVPFILDLIVLYVANNPDAKWSADDRDPLGPLLESVCRREMKRQEIPISEKIQMQIFEDLFLENSESIAIEDIALYVSAHADTEEVAITNKFRSHAFFSSSGDARVVKPRFEILKTYFIARYLARHLLNATWKDPTLVSVAKKLAESSTGNTDTIDWLFVRLKKLPNDQLMAAIRHSREMIAAKSPQHKAISTLFHIAARVAYDRKLDPKEKSQFILDCMGDPKTRTFKELMIQGGIRNVDLSGIIFDNCQFTDAEFGNCSFSGETLFKTCGFEGSLAIENCAGAGAARRADCSYSSAADNTWAAVSGGKPTRKVIEQLAEEALNQALKKFMGAYGFSTLKFRDRLSGVLRKNPFHIAVWERLLEHGILETHVITNISDGGLNLVKNDEIRHEVRMLLDGNIIGTRLAKVKATLVQQYY